MSLGMLRFLPFETKIQVINLFHFILYLIIKIFLFIAIVDKESSKLRKDWNPF